jgi:hypothetical protein
MAEKEKPTEPEFQVVTVGENAVKAVEAYVKQLEKENPALGTIGFSITGTNCRITTHNDLHCNDHVNV